jgi:hypothetical protein
VAKSSAPAPNDAPAEPVGPGKGRATPSRAEQEAARKRPLVADTKEAKQRARSELAAARERARAGMAAGEERYLPVRDKGPQRRFARDFVDAGLHLGEGVMPFMVLVIVMTFVPVPAFQYWAFVALWIYVLFVIGDMVVTSIRVKRAARAKFGADRLERGLGWYAAMRTVQMRFMRLPKPQVKRFQRPA